MSFQAVVSAKSVDLATESPAVVPEATTQVKGISLEYFKKETEKIFKNMDKDIEEIRKKLAQMKQNVDDMKKI